MSLWESLCSTVSPPTTHQDPSSICAGMSFLQFYSWNRSWNLLNNTKPLRFDDFFYVLDFYNFSRQIEVENSQTALNHNNFTNFHAIFQFATEVANDGANTSQIPCNDCDAKFANKYSLQKHWKICHDPQNQDKKQYVCPECKESFSLRKFLKNHRIEKHGLSDKPHACSICDKRFTYPKQLRSHQKSAHQGTK